MACRLASPCGRGLMYSVSHSFYRAMHVVLTRHCDRKSSVCSSITLTYRGYIGLTSSKLITRIISLVSSLVGATTSAIKSIPNGTPLKFGWNRGGVAVLRKHAISLKRGKIEPRLLLMTNRKLHTRFRLVPKSTILYDLEGALRTVVQNVRLWEPTTKK